MDTNNLITIGPMVLTVSVVILSAVLHHISNQKGQLFAEKLRIYRAYIDIVSMSTKQTQDKKDLLVKHISSKQELILFAPKIIIETAGRIEPLNFTTSGQTQEEADAKYNEYLVLLNLMRLDLRKTNKKISIIDLRNLLG